MSTSKIASPQIIGLDSILDKSIFKKQRKNKYSFPKSPRFPSVTSNYTIDYYERPSLRDTRTCSFGYGTKNFFNKPQNVPSASQYNIQGQKHHGQTFGLGRQKIVVNSYLKNSQIDTPNSTKYNPSMGFNAKHKRSPSCFLVSKHAEDSFLKPANNNPEPSLYDQSLLNKNGKATLSQFPTARKPFFPKEDRFSKIHQKREGDIGPGAYDPKFQKYKEKGYIIPKTTKKTYVDLDIQGSQSPGPIYYIP